MFEKKFRIFYHFQPVYRTHTLLSPVSVKLSTKIGKDYFYAPLYIFIELQLSELQINRINKPLHNYPVAKEIEMQSERQIVVLTMTENLEILIC
jgi:hypothetical protein